MISDPSKSCVGILCVALANRFATNAEPTGDADKVSDLNRLAVTQDYSAVPTILDDQRRGISSVVVRVPVADQFECRHRTRDSWHYSVARPRCTQCGQISPEFQRNLAFDTQINKIRRPQLRRRRMDRSCEDRSAAWMRDAHQFLHHLGCGGNLGPGNGAIYWLRKPIINLLCCVGLGDGCGPELAGQGGKGL